ncbi:hypothetical protein MHSWG343_04510 [Candidatus Mycoplasma haematohominis]|uniref:Uncharacterized protein n=1 Tax=Candidatus Mycoplasma haematohominis TaxID=1494318 RepID=A0A478FR46_9MOLU|nr:hypothetical protein MHSWG343_04510 [Candidatus Mycoplasma haemohominis]
MFINLKSLTNAISLSDKPAIATPAKKLSTSGILFATVPISITIYLIHLYIDEIMGGETGGAAPAAVESQEETSAESSENNSDSSETTEVEAKENTENDSEEPEGVTTDETSNVEEEVKVAEAADAESQKAQPQEDESAQIEPETTEATEFSSSNSNEASLSGNGMDRIIPTLMHNLSILRKNGRDWIKDANGLKNAHAIFHTVSALNRVLAIGQKRLQEEITKYQEAKKAE